MWEWPHFQLDWKNFCPSFKKMVKYIPSLSIWTIHLPTLSFCKSNLKTPNTFISYTFSSCPQEWGVLNSSYSLILHFSWLLKGVCNRSQLSLQRVFGPMSGFEELVYPRYFKAQVLIDVKGLLLIVELLYFSLCTQQGRSKKTSVAGGARELLCFSFTFVQLSQQLQRLSVFSEALLHSYL